MPSEALPEYHSPFIQGLHPKFSRENLRDSFVEDKEREIPSTKPLGIASPRAPPSSERSSEATQQDSMEDEQLQEAAMPSMSSNGNGNEAPGEVSYAEAVLEDLNDKGVSPADRLLNRKTEFEDHNLPSTDSSTRKPHNKPLNGTHELEKEVKEYDGNYLTSTKMPEEYEEALEKNKLEDPVLRGRAKKARKDKLESGRQAGEGWHKSA